MSVLLLPPIAFLIFIFIGLIFSHITSSMAAKGTIANGTLEAYACGQSEVDHNVSPDYSQFFSVAFFFTIVHVAVLVIATFPSTTIVLPILYILAAGLTLHILFRR